MARGAFGAAISALMCINLVVAATLLLPPADLPPPPPLPADASSAAGLPSRCLVTLAHRQPPLRYYGFLAVLGSAILRYGVKEHGLTTKGAGEATTPATGARATLLLAVALSAAGAGLAVAAFAFEAVVLACMSGGALYGAIGLAGASLLYAYGTMVMAAMA